MSPVETVTTNLDRLTKTAVDAPTIFFALVAIVVPLAIFVGLALLIRYWILPAWRDEKEADRKQKASDAAEFRKLIDEQHGRIVERVEKEIGRHSGELDKLHAKFDKQSDVLQRIAAKLALPTLLVFVYLGGLVSGFGIFVAARKHQSALAANCPNGCGALDCCGDNKCCERKQDTAKTPSSATALVKLNAYAGPGFCSRTFHSTCY